MSENQQLPRWNMENVFPGLDSDEFKQANETFAQQVDELEKYLKTNQIHPNAEITTTDPVQLASLIRGFIERSNAMLKLGRTIANYIYSFTTTDSYNQTAAKARSIFQPVMIKTGHLGDVLFKGWLAKAVGQIESVIDQDEILAEHAFYLKETIHQSKFMMSATEEELAGQLSLSGLQAWSKLQNDITSQLTWPLEGQDGKVKQTPLTAIINLRNHEDETMRRRGYEIEQKAWKSVEVPLAAALNGIKGAQGVLWKRRNWEDPVHQSIVQSRIDRETLEAMLGSMRNSFPMFRKYFKAKAKYLGKETLPWWDLKAPLGKTSRTFTYPEAQNFVLENFGKFSEELAEFANTSFVNNWIDVGPREGKGAGAFCMSIPALKESRILLNYENNLDWVFTLAHELGHGFHNQCLFERNRTPINSGSPMTVAETASIMCETIVTDAAIKIAADKQEELAILETALMGTAETVVDIYSRYLFETEVFNRRQKAELSADEFSQIMEWAQAETYGDGLDASYRQKYMWTWKPHYYIPTLSFYNFPYAFGLLFGTGLYAIFEERGSDFVADYKDLLSSTGMASAPELARRFGIDLRSPAFWDSSIGVIGQRIERYINLQSA